LRDVGLSLKLLLLPIILHKSLLFNSLLWLYLLILLLHFISSQKTIYYCGNIHYALGFARVF
jgi:hypothetical protein